LIVNDDLYFDTIVIRRPTGFSGDGTDLASYTIILNEIQCWVNANNILIDDNTTSYFADWAEDKDVDIGEYLQTFSTIAHNNEIEATFGAVSPFDRDETVALIISGFPITEISKIQSIVVYNRQDVGVSARIIGLALELYSRKTDVNLESQLASTNEISSYSTVYRYDFPAIDTYPSGDFSDTNSTSQIASETLALKEVISEFADSVNITGGLKADTITTTGNVTITGDLVVGTTNIIDEIGTTQDEINDGELSISKTSGLQIALDNKYNDTGGNISGNVTITGDLVIGTTNIIDEIGTKQDEINDGDLTISKTSGLQTALDNKYDDTGGDISGDVQVSGVLQPNGNIITGEKLIIQSGATMELLDDIEVKLSSGIVDIVLDGVDESIQLNGYTLLNGSLELAEDESIFITEVGGGNSKVLNYFNYNKLTDDVEGKQDEINDGDLTILNTA